MHCPKCGKEVRVSLVCPSCGEELKQQGPPPRLPDEPSVGIPRSVMLIILLVIMLIGGYFFLQSNVYLMYKARTLIANGEFAQAIDILENLIDKKGTQPDLVDAISDAMLAQAGQRMDEGDYREAMPVIEMIIQKNNEFGATAKSRENLLKAYYNKAVSSLGVAQGENKYIVPFATELTDAETAAESAWDIIEEIEADWIPDMKADLHMVAAYIATERASYFNHNKDKSQAKVYLAEAEKELAAAIDDGGNKPKFRMLGAQISELRGSIYSSR